MMDEPKYPHRDWVEAGKCGRQPLKDLETWVRGGTFHRYGVAAPDRCPTVDEAIRRISEHPGLLEFDSRWDGNHIQFGVRAQQAGDPDCPAPLPRRRNPMSSSVLPPGTCGIHGYHGRSACPNCSTSTLPFTPLIQSPPGPTSEPICPGCKRPVSVCQAEDVYEVVDAPGPASVSPAEPPGLGMRVGYVCNPGVVALGVVSAIYEDGRVRIRWDDGWTDAEGAVYGFDDLLRVKS